MRADDNSPTRSPARVSPPRPAAKRGCRLPQRTGACGHLFTQILAALGTRGTVPIQLDAHADLFDFQVTLASNFIPWDTEGPDDQVAKEEREGKGD